MPNGCPRIASTADANRAMGGICAIWDKTGRRSPTGAHAKIHRRFGAAIQPVALVLRLPASRFGVLISDIASEGAAAGNGLPQQHQPRQHDAQADVPAAYGA